MAANRDVECPLALLWRHRPSIHKKINGIQTTIIITRTILKLNSWDFLTTSTILCWNCWCLATIHWGLLFCHYDGQKIEKNRFVINVICKLISIKSLVFRFRPPKFHVIIKLCHAEANQTYYMCDFIQFIFGVTFF